MQKEEMHVCIFLEMKSYESLPSQGYITIVSSHADDYITRGEVVQENTI